MLRRHVVEQGRADEEAVLVTLQREAAAVDDQLGAFIDAHLDVALDRAPCGRADHRAVVGLVIGATPDRKAADRRDQLLAQGDRRCFSPTGTTTGKAMQRSPAEP